MSHGATARLFIALDPPGWLTESLASWARSATRAAGLQSLRLLERDTLHVTICFLGSLPLEAADELAGAVERASSPLGECSLGAPLWLPRRRPRALSVEVRDDERALAALHRSMLAELARIEMHPDPRGEGNARALRPHVTVARLPAGRAPGRRELAPTPALSFVPERLTLYRSYLHRDGASYEPLASFATPPLAA
jgi:2'-5' RNA ligase